MGDALNNNAADQLQNAEEALRAILAEIDERRRQIQRDHAHIERSRERTHAMLHEIGERLAAL
jgi:hypothetical protein